MNAGAEVIELRRRLPRRSNAQEGLSFDAVYEQHFDQVYRWVRRLAPGADAEDLTQEVFVVVHRRLFEFEGRAKLTTWLFQITYRVLGAYVRRERLRRATQQLLGILPGVPVAEPLQEAIDNEMARAVREALEALPLKQRTVLVLFELEEWSCQQIAEALKVPLATVYTRLHHGRKQLARRVAFRTGGRHGA